MNEINLPPFYVGQKVVTIKRLQVTKVKKGVVFIVKKIKQCKKCGEWVINIGLTYPKPFDITCICGTVIATNVIWVTVKFFAPIQENFQSIELSEVLETETKLISVN